MQIHIQAFAFSCIFWIGHFANLPQLMMQEKHAFGRTNTFY